MKQTRSQTPKKGPYEAASGSYTADEAARLFGIPRIAPVAAASASGLDPHRSSAGDGAAEIEDLTESLTADERETALADPVTTQVQLPAGAALTTVTLLAAPGQPRAAGPGSAPEILGESRRALPRVLRWGLWGAGVGLVVGAALLLFRGLPRAELPTQVMIRATRAAPREAAMAQPSAREAILEQAAFALGAGKREQALALLLRYQASQPDHTVEILIRVLKKQLHVAPGAP